MKKRIFTTSIIMLGLTLTLLWLPGPLFGQPKYEKEILVFFSSGVERAESGQPPVVSSQGVQQVLNKFGISRQDVQPAFPEFNERDTVIIMPDGRRVNRPNMARIFRILVADPTDREMLIQDLKLLENVGFAELNGRADVDVVPNDEYYSFQWSLQEGGGIGRIQAPEAWDIYTGNSTTKIAIIDLGVDGTHPDLSGKFSGHTTIFDHHGTHVAGIAAAKTNNLQVGIAGVDWNAQILAKSFIDGSESGDPYLYQIIMEAVNEGSHVLNNSWRLAPTGRYSTTVRIAFANAYKLNRVSTATIGNTGPTENIVQYPGSFAQGIIAVGSTSSQDVVSDFSTRGNSIDVAAPGEDILSTYRNGNFPGDPNYHTTSGTSMSAPHVSGLASLLKGYNPNLYNDDIENIIKLSADKVSGMSGQDWTNEYGYGRVNAHKALLLANSVQHASITGGSSIGFVNGHTPFYGVSGLTDGYNYLTERHEVRTSVTFSPAFQNIPAVWGRGVATAGFNTEDPNFGLGFCEPVPGTITTTGVQLRTYVYDVWVPDINSPDGKGQYMGRFPADFPSVVLAYSKMELPSPAVPPAPQSLVVSNHGQGGQNPQLSWQYTPLSDFDHYNIYRKYESEQNFSLIGTSGSTAYTDLGTTLSSTWFPSVSYYVTAVNQQSAESDPSNTATTGGEPSTLGGENAISQLIPNEYSLLQNYPNPFNPETEIVYGLPEPSDVRIVISDILGRELLTLMEARQTAGYHRKRWLGVDASGEKLGSGAYLLRITAKGETGKEFTQVIKLALTK